MRTLSEIRYAPPSVTLRRIEPEGWIATTPELRIINTDGSVAWDGEDTLGDQGGPTNGGTEGGNVVVTW
jgi:hypothetical protein